MWLPLIFLFTAPPFRPSRNGGAIPLRVRVRNMERKGECRSAPPCDTRKKAVIVSIVSSKGKSPHRATYPPLAYAVAPKGYSMSARADSTTSGQLAPSVISVYHTPKTVKGLLFSQAKKVAAPPLTVFQGGVIRNQHRRAICSRGFEPPLGAVAKASGGGRV